MYDNDDPDYDPLDDLADAVDDSHASSGYAYSAQPARTDQCTNCGASVAGLAIGSPCPSCGTPVGSPGGGYRRQKTNGKAIACMVLGICSIPTCMCYGIPSLILGVIGLIFGSIASGEMRRSRGKYTDSSKGMNMAGKICSWIGIALGLCYIILLIFVIAMAETSQYNQNTYPY